jgi:hypothetical protein
MGMKKPEGFCISLCCFAVHAVCLRSYLILCCQLSSQLWCVENCFLNLMLIILMSVLSSPIMSSP